MDNATSSHRFLARNLSEHDCAMVKDQCAEAIDTILAVERLFNTCLSQNVSVRLKALTCDTYLTAHRVKLILLS